MKHAIVVSMCLFVGCGGYAPEPQESSAQEPAGDAASYAARIAELEQTLQRRLGSDARPLGTAPSTRDCETGAELRDRICELAERICAIAQRESHDAELAVRCTRARAACSDARARVTAVCE